MKIVFLKDVKNKVTGLEFSGYTYRVGFLFAKRTSWYTSNEYPVIHGETKRIRNKNVPTKKGLSELF